MNFRWRSENFITQSHIHRQRGSELHIILNERGHVRITFVFAKYPGTAAARRHVAQPIRASVLLRALAQEKVAEGTNVEQSVRGEWRVDHHLVPLHFGAHPDGVPAPCE